MKNSVVALSTVFGDLTVGECGIPVRRLGVSSNPGYQSLIKFPITTSAGLWEPQNRRIQPRESQRRIPPALCTIRTGVAVLSTLTTPLVVSGTFGIPERCSLRRLGSLRRETVLPLPAAAQGRQRSRRLVQQLLSSVARIACHGDGRFAQQRIPCVLSTAGL